MLISLLAGTTVLGQNFSCNDLFAHDSAFFPEDNRNWNYYSLGCTETEWDGYFAPENWTVTDEETGVLSTSGEFFYAADGKGEDPDGILVKGARTRVRGWSIELPATGFLSFRILGQDGANFGKLAFAVNDRIEKLGNGSDGVYYSPFLRTGDRFTLFIPPGEEPIAWSKLYFHTNTSGVMVDLDKPRLAGRYRTIILPPLERIDFPDARYGGWPVFDYDGDPATLGDRCDLRETTEFFDFSYADEVVRNGDHYELVRTFNISENCARGNSLEREVVWAVLPLLVEGK